MVQSPFPIDNPPLCTIQVLQIVTSSGLNRWRSAGPMREVRRMARTSFWLAFSRWRGWQRPAEHPQQPRVCHIGHGFHPEQEERLVLIAPSARPRFGYPTWPGNRYGGSATQLNSTHPWESPERRSQAAARPEKRARAAAAAAPTAPLDRARLHAARTRHNTCRTAASRRSKARCSATQARGLAGEGGIGAQREAHSGLLHACLLYTSPSPRD